MAMTSASVNSVISSEQVEGTAVYNAGGDKLGSIDDLMIVSTQRTHLEEGRAFGGECEQVVSCAASDAAAVRRCGYAAVSEGAGTRPSDRHTDRAH